MTITTNSFSELPEFYYFTHLERALLLRAGFFESILDDEDWSFVIKLHALVEAAASHLLVKVLGDARLHDFVTRIEMSNMTTGKLAIIRALVLLDKESRTFLQKLSEMRNLFIHDVANASITLDGFFSSLAPDEANAFSKAFRWGYGPDQQFRPNIDGERVHVNEFTKSLAVTTFPYSKKLSLWFGCAIIFQQIYHVCNMTEVDTTLKELGRTLLALTDIDSTKN